MSRPSVSILIPAFRPDWLDVAVASALAQTHTDFELLVSDDSPGNDVQQVMAKWTDPRIRCFRNPRRGELNSNPLHLIDVARGDYLKFLFDDDYLMPESVERLLRACRSTGAKLGFHARHFVDEKGRVLSSPSMIEAGGQVVVPRSFFFDKLVARSMNLIGEPTNVLIHAATLRQIAAPFVVNGRMMRFLGDVALYANFYAHGHALVGIGYFGSAFRQHGSQTSGQAYAGYAAGHYEWEFLRRWAVDRGLLGEDAYRQGQAAQMPHYQQWATQFPELQPFIDLHGRDRPGPRLDEGFVEALRLADLAIDMRKLRQAA